MVTIRIALSIRHRNTYINSFRIVKSYLKKKIDRVDEEENFASSGKKGHYQW